MAEQSAALAAPPGRPAEADADLERRTRLIGDEIFARLDRHQPMLLTPAWWDEQMMTWATARPALKTQLFRFVDVLPALGEANEVVRHLREYLSEAGREAPRWLTRLLSGCGQVGVLGQMLAWAARTGARRMARKFIAGANLAEAVQAIRALRANKFAFTIDLLGEATVTEAEADQVQKQYLELIAGLTREIDRLPEEPEIDADDRGPLPRVNVSIKLSALFSQFDPIDLPGTTRAVLRRLAPILAAARQTGAFVNFDMEQYSFKDATLHIFREILSLKEFRDWPNVGIAIQAYLRDTERDLLTLRDWARQRQTPVWVRLVKGAYWDYETAIAAQQGWPVPVWTRKWESDACYERCTDFLLANVDHLIPAFASHNVRSIAHALARAERYQIPQRRLEIQMLYGMGDPIKQALQSMGYRVRVYTPYGQLLPGMAYLVRRLLENSSNDSFLKASFREGVRPEELLMNPVMVGEQRPPATREPSRVTKGSHRDQDIPLRMLESFRNEPLTDFSVADHREAMQRALAEVRSRLGQDYPLFLAGREQGGGNGWLESVNPSNPAELIGRVASASVEDAQRAIAAAAEEFPRFRDLTVMHRVGMLRRCADEFRRRRFELAAWIILETGKPWREADADVAEAIDFCEYYAADMLRLSEPLRRRLPGEENTYFYDARGVAVVIAPWNFPLAILTGMTVASLVTGNPVIIKPAEQSSVVGAQLLECLRAAGVPANAVQFLPGVGEVIGPTLVQHPDVALIAFTGSRGVGLAINEQAARTPPGQHHVKRVIAEMGGKNAILIDDDADLDDAVRGVIDSAFGYAGQKCSACSRVIVLEGRYEAFLNRLVEAARSLTIAPAEDPGCAVGPVIDAEAYDRLRNAITRAQAEARLVYAPDSEAIPPAGYFIGPHIFADVPESSFLAQEELFGPVLAVMKARDLTDALRIANATSYALTGGFYSRSPQNIQRVQREFRVGNLYINRKCTGALVDRQPFGGFKLSGIGSKTGGPDYLLQFLLPRVVTENTMRHGFVPTEA